MSLDLGFVGPIENRPRNCPMWQHHHPALETIVEESTGGSERANEIGASERAEKERGRERTGGCISVHKGVQTGKATGCWLQ